MSHRNTVIGERLDDLARGHRLGWNQLAEAIGLTAQHYIDALSNADQLVVVPDGADTLVQTK